MSQRRLARTFLWALLVALGCTGGSGGAGGCGGCAGCGGSCLAPIPGGFLPENRAPNALSAKITATGFDLLEEQVAAQVAAATGGASIDIPCSDASQRRTVLGQSVEIKVHACDLNADELCTAADEDPALRVDVPPHGETCRAAMDIHGVSLVPHQNADGTVDLEVRVELGLKTGKIPIRVKMPLCSAFDCAIEFDADEKAPPYIPLTIRLKLKVDPANGDILTFDPAGLDDLTQQIDSSELHITSEGGSGCRFGCDILSVDLVKELLFGRLERRITLQIRDAFDQLRCRACEPLTGACPQGSTCNVDQGVCYSAYNPSENPAQDQRICPPALLGVEGRSKVDDLLGTGSAGGGELDLSIVAGGKNPDGKPSHREQTGGLVLGLLGGSGAPVRSQCVPLVRWPPRPPPTPVDFDVEAASSIAGGGPVGAYDFGFGVSDNFIDKLLFDAWATGVLCLELGSEQVSALSSGLFGTFIRSLGQLTHGEEVPMLIVLRPREAPSVVIGRGTTKPGPDGTSIPDDPLLTFEMKRLQIDFYAFLEERDVRLFSLVADVTLPISLEFDGAANTITPVLGGFDALLSNVEAENIEMLFDEAADLESVLSSLIALVQPAIADALQPIAVPEVQGLKLEVKSARGSVKFATAPGYEHMTLFADATTLAPAPLVAGTDTAAQLLETRLPTPAEILAGDRRNPVAVIGVQGAGVQPLDFEGYEYAWRLAGGLWTQWQRTERLEIASPLFRLQGRHELELRARQIGAPQTADATPARVTVEIDFEAPRVRLELDLDTRTVRTLASDRVSRDDELSFRYRVSGLDWSQPGGVQHFGLDDLGSNPSLEVEVTDAAGLGSHAVFGEPADEISQRPPVAAESSNGCSQAGFGVLALLGLAGLLRRR